jgi:hypothetical protein
MWLIDYVTTLPPQTEVASAFDVWPSFFPVSNNTATVCRMRGLSGDSTARWLRWVTKYGEDSQKRHKRYCKKAHTNKGAAQKEEKEKRGIIRQFSTRENVGGQKPKF